MSTRTRKGSGPRTERKKPNRLEARITNDQKALLQAAADLRGQTLTEFVVRASEDAATKALERAGVIVLSKSDSAAFVEAVLNPSDPGPELRSAAARYRAHRSASSA